MESIYILLPIALVLLGLIIAVFFWAVRSGQFDDLDGPAYSILFDDDQSSVKPTGKSATQDIAGGAKPPKP